MPTEHVSVVLDRIANALNRKNEVVTAPTYKLVDSATGLRLSVGDRVKLFRDGQRAKLVSWSAPTHEGSTGRVYVELLNGNRREFFPSVIRAKIVEVRNG
jgi:hypothetical protein